MPEPDAEQPRVETPAPPPATPGPTRRVLQVAVTYLWFFGSLFLAAGRLDWVRGWIYVGLSVTGITAMRFILQRYNPELMAERAKWRHKDTKRFDKIFMVGFLPLALLHPAVAGLDAVRYRWSSIPFAFVYVGAVLFVASLVLLTWAMVLNPYAEGSVRIQTDRAQTVVTSGPYRFVRHPMYVGIPLMHVGSSLVLGSVWALVMSAVMILLLVWRTAQEDRTLRRELPGYEDFATHTRYRLLPGVW